MKFTDYIEANEFIDYNEIDLKSMNKEELEELKSKIRAQRFLSPEDMQYLGLIDKELIGIDTNIRIKSKFKKSKRVSPFNKKRI